MHSMRSGWSFLCVNVLLQLVLSLLPLRADFADSPADSQPNVTSVPVPVPVPDLTAQVRKSLVVVRASGRTAENEGLGSGFAIGDSGLIVTARHVIGDGRDILVELPDGRSTRAIEIYASSNRLDLAVIRIPETSVPGLELGSESLITQGHEVIAMGHPRGLRHSVVTGIISGRHEVEGVSMIQLAMPIEPGNSGGPVVDRSGRVLGIVTMKSTASDNLGFAIPVDLLHDLLDHPNPVPIERWRTIGALDPGIWTIQYGANWRQRAGRISVDGTGNSFGGRSLCLSNAAQTELPFELQVTVRLKNESGAAGLIFHADGAERHYGFYPSAGNLRLTRFDGPDVQSWTILHNAPHAAYRPGAWNTLRVSVTEKRFVCYVNGQKVVESTDDVISAGNVGLATFRGTEAEFRGFIAAAEIPDPGDDPEALALMNSVVAKLQPELPPAEQLVKELLPIQQHTTDFLQQQADRLELQAKHLRQLAAAVHQAKVQNQLVGLLLGSGEQIDQANNQPKAGQQKSLSADDDASSTNQLLLSALLIAKLDNEEVDLNAYLNRVDQMAEEIRAGLPENSTEEERLAALDDYLFRQNGFHGSRFDYYTRSNSYINEVIDDREGLPITLSVIYIALGQKLDLNVTGVGFPGHFMVRFQPTESTAEWSLIDPFEAGKRISEAQAASRLLESGYPNLKRYYESQSTTQIVQRMLMNLLNLSEAARDDESVLKYLEVLAEIAPDELEYRAKRLEMRARTGRLAQAIQDVDWFIEERPEGTDHDRIQQLRTVLQQQLQQQLISTPSLK